MYRMFMHYVIYTALQLRTKLMTFLLQVVAFAFYQFYALLDRMLSVTSDHRGSAGSVSGKVHIRIIFIRSKSLGCGGGM